MLKYLPALALSLSALTATAAESAEPRAGEAIKVAGGEMVKTAAVRTPASPPREVAAKPQTPENVSWEMVLAALALMAAVALRRFGSGPR